jgi:aminobenzoyl-glutamate utilization protein B
MSNHKIPNKVLAEVVHSNFQQIGPPKFSEEEQQLVRKLQEQMGVAQTGLATSILPFSGGHTVVCDTSEYSWNAPYASLWVAMGPENAGWHHWGVALCASGSMGRKSMDIAAKVISASAIDLLEDPGLILRAQEELSERLNGETYNCLLPDNYTPPVHLNEETMKKYFK